MSLVVSGLSVHKSGRAIVSDVSFAAPAGQVIGLIGPNGAGKSTLLAALLGLVSAQGTIRFEDADLPSMPRRDRARLAAMVEQSASTEERLTVRDVVALGRIPFEPAWQAEPGPGPGDAAVIEAALKETGMTAFATRLFHTLSGGEQQRVHLARALAQEPRLLLLDEPTSHLDIAGQLQLLDLLRAKAASGTTVLIALHDLNLAARFCDHLIALAGGRCVAQGRPTDTLTPALLEAVYGVRARMVADAATGRPLIVYDEAISRTLPQIPD